MIAPFVARKVLLCSAVLSAALSLAACADAVTSPTSPTRAVAKSASHDDDCLSGWVIVGGELVCGDP